MPLMAERKRKIVSAAMLQQPVWTLRRQVLGNIVPLLISGPMIGFGLWWMYRSGRIFSVGLILVAAAILIGWIMLNYLGLHENAQMKQQMAWRLSSALKDLPSRRYFVGMATPNFVGWIDPHEDVGYLLIFRDRIDYHGEKIRASFRRSEIRGFESRMNVHSLIFLGGWVVVRAERDGKPIELRVEMREKHSLRANRGMNKLLLSRLRKWLEA
jgi:hypothetical protein